MSRRENRNNKTASLMKSISLGRLFAGMCVAAGAAGFMGCSENSTTAGVLSETESGQTASLTVAVSGTDDNLATIKMALTRTIDNRTTIIDSAIVDSNMRATFAKVPYSDFGIIAIAYDKNDNVISNGIISSEDFAKDHLQIDSGSVNFVKMDLHKPAFLQVRNDIAEFNLGDSLCISRTISCGVYDEAAKEAGYVTINAVPSSARYSQIEIVSAQGVQTQSVSWYVTSTDTILVTHQGLSQVNEVLEFTLPKVSYLDSLNDKTLDSLLVPFKVNKADSTRLDYDLEFFQDANWNLLPDVAFITDDGLFYWITLPSMDSSVQIYRSSTEIDNGETIGTTRAFAFWPSLNAGDTAWRKGNIFDEDSSFVLSFWATLDSAKSDSVISAVQGNVGFEIRRCDSNPNAICTKIYNGIDTAATDTVEYGKTKLFDGKTHHYSLAIHKKHLSIVVDGNVVRSTDLKLSEKFYELTDVKVGADIENLLFYSFGDFIRKPEDKGWHRLNAWLQAFYELQK